MKRVFTNVWHTAQIFIVHFLRVEYERIDLLLWSVALSSIVGYEKDL